MKIDKPEYLGIPIRRISTIHDYIQLFFSNGGTLNIYNNYDLIDVELGEPASNIAIYEFVPENDRIILNIRPRGSIVVWTRNSDYRGPESMEYSSPGGERTVWP